MGGDANIIGCASSSVAPPTLRYAFFFGEWNLTQVWQVVCITCEGPHVIPRPNGFSRRGLTLKAHYNCEFNLGFRGRRLNLCVPRKRIPVTDSELGSHAS